MGGGGGKLFFSHNPPDIATCHPRYCYQIATLLPGRLGSYQGSPRPTRPSYLVAIT